MKIPVNQRTRNVPRHQLIEKFRELTISTNRGRKSEELVRDLNSERFLGSALLDLISLLMKVFLDSGGYGRAAYVFLEGASKVRAVPPVTLAPPSWIPTQANRRLRWFEASSFLLLRHLVAFRFPLLLTCAFAQMQRVSSKLPRSKQTAVECLHGRQRIPAWVANALA